jgi:hypothetical protein
MLRYDGPLPPLADVDHLTLPVRPWSPDGRVPAYRLVLMRFDPRLVPRLGKPDLRRVPGAVE